MPQDYFSTDHEYIRVDGDVATIGITNHAQEQLGDVVFVEVPEVGRQFTVGEAAGVVESVKAASEVYAPIAGEVTEANGELDGNPALVNEDPEGAAWFFKLRIADAGQLNELMSREKYDAFVAENS
ncbi:MAG: glycine cleavage system protein GcvH [Hyphomicrobiaceae bacterium]